MKFRIDNRTEEYNVVSIVDEGINDVAIRVNGKTIAHLYSFPTDKRMELRLDECNLNNLDIDIDLE